MSHDELHMLRENVSDISLKSLRISLGKLKFYKHGSNLE
jgi:hypothetical protein